MNRRVDSYSMEYLAYSTHVKGELVRCPLYVLFWSVNLMFY